jgi:formylglycine-generating enzyme required for sulfatase activity
VLVVLSGHGQELETKREDGTIAEDGFFCPVDAVADDPATMISISDLTDNLLAKLGGKNLVLVDACRDNPVENRKRSARNRGVQGKVVALPEDTAILFACRSGKSSEERDDLGHSIFSYCVLDAMSKEGTLNWTTLVDRVQDHVQELSPGQEPISAGAIGRVFLGRNEARQEGTRAGEERDENALKMKFCWCPAGTFRMGSPADEPGRWLSEGPVDVRLTRGFWMGKYEVTQSEWRRVMGSMPSGNFAWGQGDNYPIYWVSHDDAVAFCRKLTEAERGAGRLPSGWDYRLPTEAQWEYACRAGTTTATAFGDKLSSTEPNFDGNHPYNGAEKGPYLQKTAELGSYRPNGWGLHDMHGNVWEWCADWYDDKLAGGDDPVGPAQATRRVIRGGGWDSHGLLCRSAFRYKIDPGDRGFNLGFRVTRVPSGG